MTGRGPGRTVAVLGAGVAGLAAARSLRRAGCRVVVLEREACAGGMAAGFDAGGMRLDRYYHYFNEGDDEAARTVQEVLPGRRILWKSVPVGMFRQGRAWPFSTPWELLTFPPLGPLDRVRLCAHLARTAVVRDPSRLQRVPAADWLRAWLGDEGYAAVWEPLLARKFGPHAPRVSAAWLWARIRRMAAAPPRHGWHRTYGYLPGGAFRLAEGLAERALEEGVEVRLGAEARGLQARGGRIEGIVADGGPLEADAVVSTLPTSLLASRIEGPGAPAWRPSTAWLPVTVLVLRLRRALTSFFWLNTNDPGFRTAGVIDTAILDPLPALAGRHLLYVPFYAATHPVLAGGDADALLDWVWDDLARLCPGLSRGDVDGRWSFRDAFGQSVCEAGEPPSSGGATPFGNLVAVDASNLHPFDRTLDGALRLGKAAAARTLAILGGSP